MYNDEEVIRFLEIFDTDKTNKLIEKLTANTQKKFISTASPEEVEKLMLELKAIHLLKGLFRDWINNTTEKE